MGYKKTIYLEVFYHDKYICQYNDVFFLAFLILFSIIREHGGLLKWLKRRVC